MLRYMFIFNTSSFYNDFCVGGHLVVGYARDRNVSIDVGQIDISPKRCGAYSRLPHELHLSCLTNSENSGAPGIDLLEKKKRVLSD